MSRRGCQAMVDIY